MKKITIVKELQDFIVPLGKEEYFQLEKNLLSEGCREALSVWENVNKDLVLIDGHNRYKICLKHKIPFKTKLFSFNNIEEVKKWMLENQLGRRNLNPDQLSYYRGLKYLSLKKKKGGYDNIQLKGVVEPSTSELLSLEFKVSESTIKRDSKYAEALNLISISNPKLKNQILSGNVKVKKSDLQTLLKDKDVKEMIILNESDLHHKINFIKREILANIEEELIQVEQNKKQQQDEKAVQDIINGVEPLFLEQDDRLKRIKGRIVSAINNAINNRDLNAIETLKALIDKLEFELTDE